MDMMRMIAGFMDYCHSKQLRPKTLGSYEQTLKLFARWLGSTLLVPREVFLQDGRMGMRMLPEIKKLFAQPVLQGEAKEQAAILPTKTTCLLEATIRGSALKKIYLQPTSEKQVEIDVEQCRIHWGENVSKSLHQIGKVVELQLIISQPFAELFIDGQTAFSFPLEDSLNCEWLIHSAGAEMKWTLRTLNTARE